MQSATESKSKLVENLLEYARNLHFDYSECELDSRDEEILETELGNYFYYELMNDGEQIVKTFINKLI